jgi:hypothetical protein
MGAGNGVTLCDLGVFADEVAETVSPQNTHVAHFYGWMETPGGRILPQRPVRPMLVVMIGVLTEDQPQVPFAGEQHPVQALAAGATHPALCDRVRPRRPDGRLDDPHRSR